MSWIATAALATATACGGDDAASSPDADVGPDAAAAIDAASGYRAEVVRHETFTRDDRSFPVELVRVTRPDGARTYLEWIRSDRPGPRAVVVSTDPYGGIDWTGEEVDERWAAHPAGTYEDVDGPGYDGSAQVVYYPTSWTDAADQEYVHLLDDFSVLRVHGRFYAGGTVVDDVEDMKAGMWFLAEQPADAVDHGRVGVYGGSWGGFESLYASAYGDRRVAPVVTVALYPPHDFAAWSTFNEGRAEPAYGATEGHRRRIYAVTGGPPPTGDFTGLTTEGLCAGLPAATLVLHDEADNLVPIAQSEHLVATCGADVVYWRRATGAAPGDASHGPLLDEPGLPSVTTYGLTYLHRRLAAADQPLIEVYVPTALIAHLTTVRDAQLRGADVAFAAPRLRELCDPRVYLLDLTTGTLPPGADAVAAAVDQVWGTTYTGATIDAALAAGLPVP
ncbi:MAG: hypothetical protein H6709_07060 [Kofleriaceae bacterium]|nr:hypothetical protein [Myxococcales bacterium]MCB9560110.1 hypothetical protein [Kofleriaceae bacterium]MCB9571837.1 hypothetical protein [Kofleriaceae bacterium]